MIGILTFTTFAPLIGVAAILILRTFAKPEDGLKRLSATFALDRTLRRRSPPWSLSVLLVANFDSKPAGLPVR